MSVHHQRARVLRAFQTYGEVCQGDFLLPDVIDGGKPITRLGARVLELREDGHTIVDTGKWRAKFKVYALGATAVPPAEFTCNRGHSWTGPCRYSQLGYPMLDGADPCPTCAREPNSVEACRRPARADVVAKAAA